MIGIPTVAANPPTNSSSELPSAQALTSLDFMKILVAEFQNQDPTAPTDPTQFATQLVQFSNLGQLEGINQAVQQSPSGYLMQAASAFIGRQVVSPGNSIGLRGGKASSIVFAPSKSDTYRAEVYDSNGNAVDNVSLGQLTGGTLQTFSWNPPSSAADGQYAVKIVDSNGNLLPGLLEQGVVQSVSLSANGVALDLGNLVLPESAVTTVAQP